jgi:hypothetical protein
MWVACHLSTHFSVISWRCVGVCTSQRNYRSGTGGDLQQKLIQRTEKRNSDIKEQNHLRYELIAATKPIIDMIGQEYQTGGDRSFTIDLLDINGEIKTSRVLAQDIKNEFSTANSARVSIIVSGRHTSANGFVEKYVILNTDRFVKLDDLSKLADRQNLWEPKDLSSLVDQFDGVSHNVDIDSEALTRIAYDIKASEVAKAAGEEPSGTSGTLSLPFLVQLNITRFGTITLASIAIGILVPLYRFSERLSAFYRARSDALRLHQAAGYKTVGIIRLSTMLTPTIDYGKSQNMPDNLAELLRLIARPEQEK